MARGIERGNIFNNTSDAQAFLTRLEKLVLDTGIQLLAFALVPNHFHLLLRRTGMPVSIFMQRLLTSYAVYFNKKYGRAGHLFQNRYKSIPCRSENQLRELVRYIHLNPLRAGRVRSLDELAKYPFSGHVHLMGRNNPPWIDPDATLRHFGLDAAQAKSLYLDFIAAGLTMEVPATVLHGRSESPDRTRDLRNRHNGQLLHPESLNHRPASEISRIISEVCASNSMTRTELLSTTKRRHVAQARARLAFRMSKELGLSGSEIGRRLSVSRSAVSKMIYKGSGLEEVKSTTVS